MTVVLVTGGRDFADAATVERVLSGFPPTSTLVHGDSPGADRLAAAYARRAEWAHIFAFPADWRRYGAAAGPIRNRRMLELCPDVCVAFPGGPGTADMIAAAIAANVPIFDVAVEYRT